MILRSSVLILLAAATPTQAQHRVHSDLPLFTDRDQGLDPYSFTDEEGFGCATRIRAGDWKFVEADDDSDSPSVRWVRFANVGMFHCAVSERWSDDRAGLRYVQNDVSWFVEMGRVKTGPTELEVWALQSGTMPGSNYLLLARAPAKEMIKRFDVLAVECPDRFMRTGKSVDVFGVDHCVINSAADLILFAKEMAQRPPVASLTFVEAASEQKD